MRDVNFHDCSVALFPSPLQKDREGFKGWLTMHPLMCILGPSRNPGSAPQRCFATAKTPALSCEQGSSTHSRSLREHTSELQLPHHDRDLLINLIFLP